MNSISSATVVHAVGLAACLSLSTIVTAQGAASSVPAGLDAAGLLSMPIHAEAGRAWASREHYKVSFHDGVAMHPVVADAPGTLRWRTLSIARDGGDLAAGERVARATDWRFTFDRGVAVERWDILPEGLEQSFFLATRPAGRGDLSIRGSVETPLRAEPVSPRHGALTFLGADGRAVLTYGAAWAIDARGDRIDVATSFDGHAITLHVDGDWLDTAAYPVVVDPLLSVATLLSGIGQIENIDVARCQAHNSLLVTFVRRNSASDADPFVVQVRNDLTQPQIIYTDSSTARSSSQVRAAFVRSAYRWCVAMDVETRDFLGRPSYRVDWFLRDAGAQGSPTPTLHSIANARRPVVGGSTSTTSPRKRALLAYQYETMVAGVSVRSVVRGALLDCGNEVVFTIVNLSDPNVVRAEYPDVSEQQMGANWDVVWQQETPGSQRREIAAILVYEFGPSLTDRFKLGTFTSLTRHNLRPRVDRADSSTGVVTFAGSSYNGSAPTTDTGTELWVQTYTIRTVVGSYIDYVASSPRLFRSGTALRPESVTQDYETGSHWCVTATETAGTPRSWIYRVGGDGVAIETWGLDLGSRTAAATYLEEADGARYAVVWGAGTLLRRAFLTYPAPVPPQRFGTACGPATFGHPATHGRQAFAGHSGFALDLGNLPYNNLAVLMLGVATANLPLPGGCMLNVVPLVTVPFTSGGLGPRVRLPLTSYVEGTVLVQAAYDHLGELKLSEGLRVQIVRD